MPARALQLVHKIVVKKTLMPTFAHASFISAEINRTWLRDTPQPKNNQKPL
jgi:hypothetical protein